jgi:hypothetical protein
MPNNAQAPDASLKELKEHIRWLEDERLDAGAVEKRLEQIDGNLKDINAVLRNNTDGLKRLLDAFNLLATAFYRHERPVGGEPVAQAIGWLAALPKRMTGIINGRVYKSDATGTVKRKRGRPLGSKNKPKRKGGWPKGKPRKPQPEAA